jgi:hypothetical protein
MFDLGLKQAKFIAEAKRHIAKDKFETHMPGATYIDEK